MRDIEDIIAEMPKRTAAEKFNIVSELEKEIFEREKLEDVVSDRLSEIRRAKVDLETKKQEIDLEIQNLKKEMIELQDKKRKARIAISEARASKNSWNRAGWTAKEVGM